MRATAEKWLRQVLGADADFHQGQWEAIEALVEKRQRVLVVQRTGWGKSLVYFLATRLLRGQGAGTTILISPLLSLMRNQIQSAEQWGIRAETINSSNPDDHARVEADLLAGKIDLLLISPERLSNDRFQIEVWPELSQQVGMLVVDEAHCISDWGHDFRPNYRRLMRVLDELPPNTPILGTTATANDRVVKDVSEILGAVMNIQRGALTRDSLHLYIYPEPRDHAYRLTLLAHLLRSIEGSGIIYCTTTRDCQVVADWLQDQGFNVRPYYAAVEETNEDESRADLENQLLKNELKALVASVALGMGFDKPDLHFVIHYQQPGNIIGYYQQIGRAGRGIERAHIILMHGPGDEDIQRHFIETAFPRAEHIEATIKALAQHGPLSRTTLQQWVNVNNSTLEKILTHLEVEQIIEKQERDFHLVNAAARPDYARWTQVTRQRYDELEQMKAYIRHDDCLMRFIADALDDPTTVQPCGKCKNCRKRESKFQADPRSLEAAQRFLRQGRPVTLEARKRWPSGFPGVKRATIEYTNEEGLALCSYYDVGWGNLVREGRLSGTHFSDELIVPAVELLRKYLPTLSKPPSWVTSVPSLRRPELVPNFARQVARSLGLPYHDVIQHTQQHAEQSTMRNSYQQALNVREAFTLNGEVFTGSVLLIDDLADSRWTLTMIGEVLRRAGSGAVVPFVLATTNTGGSS